MLLVPSHCWIDARRLVRRNRRKRGVQPSPSTVPGSSTIKVGQGGVIAKADTRIGLRSRAHRARITPCAMGQLIEGPTPSLRLGKPMLPWWNSALAALDFAGAILGPAQAIFSQ